MNPSQDNKMNLSTTAGATILPQNCQYVLFDGTNGFIQAVEATPAPTMGNIIAPSISSTSNVIRPRPSVAIAPKMMHVGVDAVSKTTVIHFFFFSRYILFVDAHRCDICSINIYYLCLG